MAMTKDRVAEFFAQYAAGVAELAAWTRGLIRTVMPEASETLDEPGRVVGYAIGPGYSGLVCTIIPSKTGVKLGVVRGAGLPDPLGLLEGRGKKHRYVQIDEGSDRRRAGIEELLRNARKAATAERGA